MFNPHLDEEAVAPDWRAVALCALLALAIVAVLVGAYARSGGVLL